MALKTSKRCFPRSENRFLWREIGEGWGWIHELAVIFLIEWEIVVKRDLNVADICASLLKCKWRIPESFRDASGMRSVYSP